MSEPIEVTRTGPRLDVVLARPERKNALTGAMYDRLREALEEAEREAEILTVVLSARGPVYCAGNDVMDFQVNPPTDDQSPVVRFLRVLASTTKVIIAAIHGPAVGVGATMLLHCDHVVAAADATLHFSFVKLALVPEAASSLLLPRAVGPLKAAELMLTGAPMPADEALRFGLVSKVTPVGEHVTAAQAFAASFEGAAPEALRAIKRLLRSQTQTVSDRMTEEGEVFRSQLGSAEFAEAAAAFMERRKPRFGGARS